MGIIYTTLKIRNFLTNSDIVELEAKVDTGATLLVLPESTVLNLKFPKIRKQLVRYANGETAEKDIVGGIEVEICGRKGWFEAIVEPNRKIALLGAIIMETLDLIVEPRELKIYPSPRSPDLPMAEIESAEIGSKVS
jgi:predicted aspartyl protease